jgi:transposase-like protein
MSRVDLERQLIAARALAEGVSVSEVSRRSGVSRTALLRLKGDDDFRELVRRARERIVDRVATA